MTPGESEMFSCKRQRDTKKEGHEILTVSCINRASRVTENEGAEGCMGSHEARAWMWLIRPESFGKSSRQWGAKRTEKNKSEKTTIRTLPSTKKPLLTTRKDTWRNWRELYQTNLKTPGLSSWAIIALNEWVIRRPKSNGGTYQGVLYVYTLLLLDMLLARRSCSAWYKY